MNVFDKGLYHRLLLSCVHRAAVLERLGRHADALDDYDRAISIDGDFAEAQHSRYSSGNELKLKPAPKSHAMINLASSIADTAESDGPMLPGPWKSVT